MSNSIQMQCRLGKDPEVREVGDATVTRLWVAESEKYKDKSGEMQERTNWWSAEVWGKRGEALARYLKRGDGVFLRGSLRQSKKEDVTYYSIHVSDWEFCMSRKGDGGEKQSSDEEESF